MWPFGKQNRADHDSQAKPEPVWTVYAMEFDDGPMVVRLQRNAKIGSEHLQYMVGIATPLHSPNSKGLHDVHEGTQLAVIGDAVSAVFETDGKAVLALSNCSNGSKEWVLYTNDPEFVKGEFVKLRDATNTHKLQLLIKSDPKWETYGTFVKLGS